MNSTETTLAPHIAASTNTDDHDLFPEAEGWKPIDPEEVEGYPFFIQLWGAELWEAASDAGVQQFTVEMLDVIEEQIYARLDEEFYVGRIETLTPSEQDVLMLSASCPYPPLKTADIRGKSAKSDGNINVLMGRLTDQGVLYRIQKG